MGISSLEPQKEWERKALELKEIMCIWNWDVLGLLSSWHCWISDMVSVLFFSTFCWSLEAMNFCLRDCQGQKAVFCSVRNTMSLHNPSYLSAFSRWHQASPSQSRFIFSRWTETVFFRTLSLDSPNFRVRVAILYSCEEAAAQAHDVASSYPNHLYSMIERSMLNVTYL